MLAGETEHVWSGSLPPGKSDEPRNRNERGANDRSHPPRGSVLDLHNQVQFRRDGNRRPRIRGIR
jgi:hypothetical protein